ncbi:MAG TPA: antitoxin Xre/MbcA/ParS toxin-binding domain-containing protein [Edaphocola sp.]|nr:antitoxin Xre/MbcA/ParS toxin-binding domain-containing protein [Edaphocola sp.]
MKKEAKYTIEESTLQDMLVEEPANDYFLQSFDFINLSREGIIKKFLIDLADKLSFTMQELAKVLHISERTLQRYHNNEKMSSDTSERALLLAQLYRRGISVLGSANNFKDWLKTPLPAFQQQTPLSYLDTAFGFSLVSDELGRIEHGIFA